MKDIESLFKIGITSIEMVHTPYTAEGSYHEEARGCWALGLKIEGRTVYENRTKNKKVVSDFHNIILIPKGSSYDYTCTKAGRIKLIEFDAQLEGDDIYEFKITDYEKFLRMHDEIEAMFLLKTRNWQFRCISAVYELLAEILDESFVLKYTDRNAQTKIYPAIQNIMLNYDKSITNEMLARCCDMSTAYFRKVFRAAMGISPMSYVMRVRIDVAKQLLVEGRLSVSQIAYNVGFSDVYQFSKMFKKHTGLSPKMYHGNGALKKSEKIYG